MDTDLTTERERFSESVSACLAAQRGNHIPWKDFQIPLGEVLNISPDDINIAKVSSRNENYYVRLNQTGFKQPNLKLGVLVAMNDVPLTDVIIERMPEKVAPRPKHSILIIQENVGTANFVATDMILGRLHDASIRKAVQQVWPNIRIHSYGDIWSRPVKASDVRSVPTDEAELVARLLDRYTNVIAEGVPGTGKSYLINGLEAVWPSVRGRELASLTTVVLHPNSTYEDFVEGLRPVGSEASEGHDYTAYPDPKAVQPVFAPKLGVFARAALAAQADPDRDHLIVLDEINRANVPKVFGDLLLVLEASKRASPLEGGGWEPTADGVVVLHQSGVRFWVPSNLHVLGTMNTSDRSVSFLDAALRRRFVFVRLEPKDAPSLELELVDSEGELPDELSAALQAWDDLNRRYLRSELGPDSMLGHSYFFELAAALVDREGSSAEEVVAEWLRYVLLPQLVEVIGSSGHMLEPLDLDEPGTALHDFQSYLGGCGLRLSAVGHGLAQRLVVEASQGSASDPQGTEDGLLGPENNSETGTVATPQGPSDTESESPVQGES